MAMRLQEGYRCCCKRQASDCSQKAGNAHRGKHQGSEEDRLRVLREAVQLGAAFVDVELKAADAFFAGQACSLCLYGTCPARILSRHMVARMLA